MPDVNEPGTSLYPDLLPALVALDQSSSDSRAGSLIIRRQFAMLCIAAIIGISSQKKADERSDD